MTNILKFCRLRFDAHLMQKLNTSKLSLIEIFASQLYKTNHFENAVLIGTN